MTVQERSEGGYVKGVDTNGNTFYRDPNGHPVKQQSFAASKQNEQYTTDIEQDPETGEITGSETVPKEPEEPPEKEPPEPPRSTRITATYKVETGTVMHEGSASECKIEIGGNFLIEPTDDEIEDIIKEIADQANETMAFVDERDVDTNSINIERVSQRRRETGWRKGKLHIDNKGGWSPNPYEVDASQKRITDSRWK